MEDFKLIKKLGSGGQGSTYTAMRLADNRSFVIKQVMCKNISEGNYALKEAKVLQRLSHASIVKYEDMFLHEKKDEQNETKLVVCIVMELCEKGDMAATMLNARRQKSQFPESMVLRWMGELCGGLAYLHGAKTLHRDLKPMNIFVNQNGSVKIGDFGLARKVVTDQMSRVGTPCYLAPEVLAHETYGEAADIWGLGCIALEMLSFNFLWEDKGLLAMKVQAKPITTAEMSDKYHSALRQAICSMLAYQAEKRPSAAECVKFISARDPNASKASRQPPAPTPQQVQREQQQQRARQEDRAEDLKRMEQVNQKQRQGAAAAAEQAAAAAAAARVHAHHQKVLLQQQHAQGSPRAAAHQAAPAQQNQARPQQNPPKQPQPSPTVAAQQPPNPPKQEARDAERRESASDEALWHVTRQWREQDNLGGEELLARLMIEKPLVARFTNNGETTPYELMHRFRKLCADGGPKKKGEDEEWIKVGRDGMVKTGSFKDKEKDEASAGGAKPKREGSGIKREAGGGAELKREGSGLRRAAVGIALAGRDAGRKGSDVPSPEASPMAGWSPLHAAGHSPRAALGVPQGGDGAGMSKADVERIFKQGAAEYEKAMQVVRQAAEIKGDWRQFGEGVGDAVYRGEMQNGMAHGMGAMKKRNGEKYAGQFEHDVYHGYGDIYYPDSTRYVGQFKNGLMHGIGYLKMANGDRYKGSFEEGAFSGYGEYVSKQSGASELGVFAEGKLQHKVEFSKSSA